MFFIYSSLALAGEIPLTQDETWISKGAGGGGALFSPSISPHDSNILFMTTDMYGVFRSKDFGRNWQEKEWSSPGMTILPMSKDSLLR